VQKAIIPPVSATQACTTALFDGNFRMAIFEHLIMFDFLKTIHKLAQTISS
jgi:hypothetical protein